MAAKQQHHSFSKTRVSISAILNKLSQHTPLLQRSLLHAPTYRSKCISSTYVIYQANDSQLETMWHMLLRASPEPGYDWTGSKTVCTVVLMSLGHWCHCLQSVAAIKIHYHRSIQLSSWAANITKTEVDGTLFVVIVIDSAKEKSLGGEDSWDLSLFEALGMSCHQPGLWSRWFQSYTFRSVTAWFLLWTKQSGVHCDVWNIQRILVKLTHRSLYCFEQGLQCSPRGVQLALIHFGTPKNENHNNNDYFDYDYDNNNSSNNNDNGNDNNNNNNNHNIINNKTILTTIMIIMIR